MIRIIIDFWALILEILYPCLLLKWQMGLPTWITRGTIYLPSPKRTAASIGPQNNRRRYIFIFSLPTLFPWPCTEEIGNKNARLKSIIIIYDLIYNVYLKKENSSVMLDFPVFSYQFMASKCSLVYIHRPF